MAQSQKRLSRQKKRQQPKSDYQALLEYSLNLLTRKWYTERELTTKLVLRCKKVGIESADDLITQILVRLRELNYINDARILDNYLEYTLPARPLGKYGFLQKMRQRGIDFAQAELAWNNKNVDEEILARQLAEDRIKRFSRPAENRKKELLIYQRKKLANFLAGRGFALNIIYEVVNDLI